MYILKKSSNLIILFVILLIPILIEGFICKPNVFDYARKSYNFCNTNFFLGFWEENGFVENIQSLFLFLSIFFLIKAKFLYKNISLINYFLLIKIFALFYYLGEEISWGQHFFNWPSPEWFIKNNNQNETNLHNISNLFDQLPRSLVIAWCIFSAPITVIFKNFKVFKENFIKILCPNKYLIFISILLLIFVLPDLIVNKLDLFPPYLNQTSDLIPTPNNDALLYQFITFNIFRLSELHELIFSFYFLFYSLSISKIFIND